MVSSDSILSKSHSVLCRKCLILPCYTCTGTSKTDVTCFLYGAIPLQITILINLEVMSQNIFWEVDLIVSRVSKTNIIKPNRCKLSTKVVILVKKVSFVK